MVGYVAALVATYAVVFSLSRSFADDPVRKQRWTCGGYGVAGLLWFVVALLQGSAVPCGVGIVFFSLAVALAGLPSPGMHRQ